MRELYHALSDLPPGADAGELLDGASAQTWMADLAERAASVALLDATRPLEPGLDDLAETLWGLYAASRVRDVLLLAHQPEPLEPAGGRPQFRPVTIDRITAFFSAIGCRPVRADQFCPALHEVVAVEQADDPEAPIEIIGEVWPALLIGELVFTRAGVRIRAGTEHAVAGVADRSTLYWEFRRHHRPTHDESFGWGHNSQWRTGLRRDYVTDRGCVYHLDGFATWQQRTRELYAEDPDAATDPAPDDSFIKNRCTLTVPQQHEDYFVHPGIDERT